MGKLFAHVQQPGWDETFDDEDISDEQKAVEQRIAVEYLTRAAEKEYSEAYPSLVSVGVDLAFGDYVTEEEAEEYRNKTFEWAKSGAALNNPQSHLDLGVLYQVGTGTEKNFKKAEESYLKAIELGNKVAPSSLAALYDEHYELFPDKISDAYYYAYLAQSRGHKSSVLETLRKHCEERASVVENSAGGFDVERFMSLALPRKLAFNPENSPTISELGSNTKITTLVEDLYNHYCDAEMYVTSMKISRPEPSTRIVDYIDELRLFSATLWPELRKLRESLASLSYYSHGEILDVAEAETDVDLQMAILEMVEIYIDLDELYDCLNTFIN